MMKIVSWVIWLCAAYEGWGWAFGPETSFGRKLFYFVALIMFGFFLIGCNADGGSTPKRNNKAPKNTSVRATASSHETCTAKSGNSHSVGMGHNIIKTHQRALPAVDNDFFTHTAKYWKENPIGHVGINGKPGVGLNSSGFDDSCIKAGQAGEKELAQMMCYLGINLVEGLQGVFICLRHNLHLCL